MVIPAGRLGPFVAQPGEVERPGPAQHPEAAPALQAPQQPQQAGLAAGVVYQNDLEIAVRPAAQARQAVAQQLAAVAERDDHADAAGRLRGVRGQRHPGVLPPCRQRPGAAQPAPQARQAAEQPQQANGPHRREPRVQLLGADELCAVALVERVNEGAVSLRWPGWGSHGDLS